MSNKTILNLDKKTFEELKNILNRILLYKIKTKNIKMIKSKIDLLLPKLQVLLLYLQWLGEYIKLFELFNERMENETNKKTAALILHDIGSKEERKEQIEAFKDGKIDFLFVFNMLLTDSQCRLYYNSEELLTV